MLTGPSFELAGPVSGHDTFVWGRSRSAASRPVRFLLKIVAKPRYPFYFIPRMHAFRTHLLLAIAIALGPLTGQDGPELERLDRQIKVTVGELNSLREEIRLYEHRIAEKEQAEEDALDALFVIEERMSLTSRLVKALEKEIDQLSSAMDSAELRIREEEEAIADLKRKLGERFAHIYKQRRASILELILTSQNWQQATYRSKYLKVAADYDRYLTKKVKAEVELLQEQREQLAQDRVRNQDLLGEKEGEEDQLLKDTAQRRIQIDKIKRDRRLDEQMLVQKKRAAVELERIVANLEFDREKRAEELAEMRKIRDLAIAADISFYRGKLPWPTNGRVITPFGQQRNRKLNTVTENPGIDIQSSPGSPVTAALDGLVTTVTYLRGYGTILIIDHGKDLYTVYAHLERVEVAEDNYVDQGQIIAYVGGNGSLDGAKLHFEVWVNGQKRNPENWLVKRFAQR